MARTKRSLEKLAARREADAALEAARRHHLAALEIAAAAGVSEPGAASAPARNDGGSISSLSEMNTRPASVGILCRYGAACYRPDCLFKHPPRTYVAQAPACRDG